VESVLAGDAVPDWIVIVDNASPDDSAEKFLAWAQGEVTVASPDFMPLRPSSKPLPLTELPESELSSAGEPETRCVFVRMSRNGGYAAGNNVGLRLGLQWGADAFLILNNDTMVERNAIGSLKRRLFSKQRPGLCGARVQYMDIKRVQCRAGGRTNPWTALSTLDGYKFSIQRALIDSPETVERRINFIYGACIMASRQFIDQVGLLDERFFLYCEEQDWSYRAQGSFDLAYADDAIVWHREGTTSNHSYRKVNLKSLFILVKSRLLVTVKHHPIALPTVCFSIFFAAFRMLWRRMFLKVQAVKL
jgi:hypothetical protein